MTKAIMTRTNLNESKLTQADLRGAELSGANLVGTNLQDARVDAVDWFEKLGSLDKPPIGLEQIRNDWKVVTIKTGNDKTEFRVRSRR